MDPQAQASFIPKKSLDVSVNNRGSGVGLVFLIALLIFVASIVAAGAAFAYTQYLTNAITSKSKSLALAEGAYDPGSIQDLARLDIRLTQAKILLDKHVAATGVFAFLATQTLNTVSFSNFSYELNTDGSAKITMQGTADSFATVALQSDQFDGNRLFSDVIFSGITADATGRINFSVSATVDASVLSYSASLANGAVPVPASAASSTSSNSTFATTTPH